MEFTKSAYKLSLRTDTTCIYFLFFFAQDDLENFGDVGSLEDNVESFLSHDGGGDGNIYGTLKQSLTEHKTEASKGGIEYLDMSLFAASCSFYCYELHFVISALFVGFSFGEVGCIRTRNKVTCCHFSSDGKLLASAGHDKKVM